MAKDVTFHGPSQVASVEIEDYVVFEQSRGGSARKQAITLADGISRFVLPPFQGTLMNAIEMLRNTRERQR